MRFSKFAGNKPVCKSTDLKENQRFYFEILRISFFIRLFFAEIPNV